jgi:hypothetical protein
MFSKKVINEVESLKFVLWKRNKKFLKNLIFSDGGSTLMVKCLFFLMNGKMFIWIKFHGVH